MPAQFINRIADLERFWEVSAVPLLFAVPGLCVLPATVTGNYFSLLLQQCIALARIYLVDACKIFCIAFVASYFSFEHHIPFEKQLIAFNNEESAIIA